VTLSQDQKHALYIGGGIALAALLWYLYQSNSSIITGSEPATVATPGAPGYMNYNVQPLNASPLVPPRNYAASGLGTGCCAGNDGCFNSNLDSGQSPVSMGQAMAYYQAQNPSFYNAFVDQLKVYKIGY
jgi:hypothetical protein